jgi:hypothetical protein
MADKKSGPPVYGWRQFDNGLKLQVLANHYGSLKLLSIYTGVSTRSLSATLNALEQGKKSKVVNRDDYISGIRRARRRMMDHIRKVEKDFQAGRYSAPIIRYNGGVIVPHRYNIFLEQSKKTVESFWIHYRTEHLPFPDQLEIARQIFEWSMETGQFNTFRFEYIALSNEYLETAPAVSGYRRKTFRDAGIKIQLEQSSIIKLSTKIYPIAESGGNSDNFLDYIYEEYAALKSRGLIRMTDLAWTNIHSFESMTNSARSEYKNTKNKRRVSTKSKAKNVGQKNKRR